MHPRNIYAHNSPNFLELADSYPKLKEFVRNGVIDFRDPRAVCTVTEVLLDHDFHLNVKLTEERLCPRVANRLNYILWLQDLLDSDDFDADSDGATPRKIYGLDIGTGASCIYPLLGCRLRDHWNFIGTDIDECAVSMAKKQVVQNELSARIKVIHITPSDPFFTFLDKANTLPELDFTMCNPPFYSSSAEYNASRVLKTTAAHSFTLAKPDEMITPGGEVVFVLRMVNESFQLSKSKLSHTWYTSMLGKLESLKVIVEEIRKLGISNYVVTEFVQGQHTRRWAIAWRFTPLRALPELVRPQTPLPSVAIRSLWPSASSNAMRIPVSANHSNDEFLDAIFKSLVDEFDEFMTVSFRSRNGSRYLLGFSKLGNVWSRNFRRQKRRKVEATDAAGNGVDAAFGFRIFVERQSDVVIHWRYGFDKAVFESFCGMLKTKFSRLQY